MATVRRFHNSKLRLKNENLKTSVLNRPLGSMASVFLISYLYWRNHANCFQFTLISIVQNVAEYSGSKRYQGLTCNIYFVSIAITCSALPAPSYGIRQNCSGTTLEYYNTVCLFSCNVGFNGYGSSSRQCQEDGTWSGQDFLCIGKIYSWVRSLSDSYSV